MGGPLDLLGCSAAELRRRVAAGMSGTPGAWVEAIRAEASRFYYTDAEAARGIARRALEVAELTGDATASGWGHRAVAEALLFSGRIREAESSYARAAEAWRTAGQNGLLGQLLVGRIHVLSLLGRMKEVEAAAREARRRLERAGDKPYLAKLAVSLGNLHFQRDDARGALAEYERAAALFAKLRIRDASVLSLEVNRAVALTQLDRDEAALALFSKLERESARRGHDLLRAQVAMNTAYVHSQRGDFDLALPALAGATGYFRRTGHPAFLASCLLNRAEVEHQLNLHGEALELAREAEPLFEAEGLHYDRALALSQGALSQLGLGEGAAAIDLLRRARALFRKERNPSRVAVMDLLWAEALARGGRRAQAERRAVRALETFGELGLVRWEAAAAVLLARLERNDPGPHLPRLRALARRVPERLYPLSSYALLEALGETEERAGRPARAAAWYGRALGRLEALRVRIPTEDSKIAFLGDKAPLFDRLLRIELGRARPSPDRLFDWLERSRAQSLWDRIRLPSAMRGGDPEADPELARERRRLSWLHARVSRLELGTGEDRAHAAALMKELASAEHAWSRALRARAERGGPRGRRDAGRTAPIPAPALSDLGRSLPDGWGFLSYHTAPGCALAIAVTSARVAWRRLAPDLGRRVAELADRLDFQWTTAAVSLTVRSSLTGTASRGSPGAPPETNAAAKTAFLQAGTERILSELYTLLWEPLVEMGIDPCTRWLVSPHGPIHRIPLHALLGKDGYLIERTDLALVPSARLWKELPRPRTGRPRTAWIAGVPSEQLPAVAAEVEQVGRRLGGWNIVRDLAPTREAVRTSGCRAHVLHLATHGSLRRDNPAYSFVQLADGPLFVHDLAGFRAKGATVVLSACSSGRGAAPAGDEWIGLARGFIQAGASTVIASLWPVDDRATLELVDLLYGELAGGTAAPVALGSAMRALRLRRPHPWHWASFAVLGGVPGRVPSSIGNQEMV